jgi:hypothetical protein
LNPARSFAPALYNKNMKNQWIYWLAPLSASFLASMLYKYVFAKDFSKNDQQIDEGQNDEESNQIMMK